MRCVSHLFQFDQDYLEFRNQIDNLRNSIQTFMDSWFQRSLSVSHLFFAVACIGLVGSNFVWVIVINIDFLNVFCMNTMLVW